VLPLLVDGLPCSSAAQKPEPCIPYERFVHAIKAYLSLKQLFFSILLRKPFVSVPLTKPFYTFKAMSSTRSLDGTRTATFITPKGFNLIEHRVFNRIESLYLSEDQVDRKQTAVDRGASSDLFRGSITRDSKTTEVAFKRLRISLEAEGASDGHVRDLIMSIWSVWLTLLPVLRKRDICLAEIATSECSASPWLYHRPRLGLPCACS
jgi:hypothetical protein